MREGIHDLTREQYDADPCPAPSLSASVAKLLLRSPMHAHAAHPRLGGRRDDDEPSADMEIGNAVHASLLGDTSRPIQVVDADSWRSKAAQDARAAGRSAGRIVLLAHQHARVMAIVTAARLQLAQHEAHAAFANGAPERTLVWRERGIWCRARLDWWPAQIGSPLVLYDLKTTGGSASPDGWARRLYDMDGDLQPAFYARGVRHVTGIDDVRFRFVAIEQDPPYALSVCELDPASMGMASRKVEAAIALWGECLRTGSWPGYPDRVCHIEAPVYAARQWLEREESPDMSRLFRLAMEMQAP